MRAIKDNAYQGLEEVHMVGFTTDEMNTLEALTEELFR